MDWQASHLKNYLMELDAIWSVPAYQRPIETKGAEHDTIALHY